MLGNQAVARGLYEAGVDVVSSYPGTPSTEITEFAAKYDDFHSEWAPNEKVACETAIGASIGGARSFCAMKHVAFPQEFPTPRALLRSAREFLTTSASMRRTSVSTL